MAAGTAGAADAQTARVAGIAGYLSEWEFSGELQRNGVDSDEFRGSLTWKHVGLCSVNGPEEKSGDVTIEISRTRPAPEIHVAFRFDGAQCRYNGPLSENSRGHMDCSDARGIPLALSIRVQ